MKNMLNRKKGFSLIETVVGLSIVILSVVSVIGLLTKGIFATGLARDQVIAGYLAQDALEFVVTKVREDFLQDPNGAWLRNFDPECKNGNKGCYINTSAFGSESILKCIGSPCPVLQYNQNQQLYGYGVGGDWVNTKFTREVVVEEVVSDVEARVTVTITWDTRISQKSIVLETNIFHAL